MPRKPFTRDKEQVDNLFISLKSGQDPDFRISERNLLIEWDGKLDFVYKDNDPLANYFSPKLKNIHVDSGSELSTRVLKELEWKGSPDIMLPFNSLIMKIIQKGVLDKKLENYPLPLKAYEHMVSMEKIRTYYQDNSEELKDYLRTQDWLDCISEWAKYSNTIGNIIVSDGGRIDDKKNYTFKVKEFEIADSMHQYLIDKKIEADSDYVKTFFLEGFYNQEGDVSANFSSLKEYIESCIMLVKERGKIIEEAVCERVRNQ